jgi:hypothetical protein
MWVVKGGRPMREVVTLAFELVWLITLVVAVAVGLMSRRPGGRKVLRRWFRFPTFVWCEAEGRLEKPADPDAIEETLNRLRALLPKSERTLVPRFVFVTIAEGGAGEAGQQMVTVRAATLLQAKTQEEAAERLAAAFGRTQPIGSR